MTVPKDIVTWHLCSISCSNHSHDWDCNWISVHTALRKNSIKNNLSKLAEQYCDGHKKWRPSKNLFQWGSPSFKYNYDLGGNTFLWALLSYSFKQETVSWEVPIDVKIKDVLSSKASNGIHILSLRQDEMQTEDTPSRCLHVLFLKTPAYLLT